MSFYVILPSNTQNDPPNKTNSFTVRLPKKLQFSSDWSVGLTSVVYPHSWSALGTLQVQSVRIEWQNGGQSTHYVPAALRTIHTAEQVERCLNEMLIGIANNNNLYPNIATKDNFVIGDELNNVDDYLKFSYFSAEQRFHVAVDIQHIKQVTLSRALAYMMGFSQDEPITHSGIAN